MRRRSPNSAQDKAKHAVHAADGDQQKQNDEQDQQDGARGGPAGAPEQIGEEHRNQSGQQQRGGIKNEHAPAAVDAAAAGRHDQRRRLARRGSGLGSGAGHGSVV